MILNLTIRKRLLLLTGTLLTLLVLSNLYLREHILDSNNTLQAQIESGNSAREKQLSAHNNALKNIDKTAEDLRRISSAIKAFGDLKYWLTDLQSSWLVESESNASAAAEELKHQLETLAPDFPEEISKIHQHVDRFTISTFKAVDAYISGNRVIGNSLQANTRLNIIAVDATLTRLNEEIQKESQRLHDQIHEEHIAINEQLRIEGVQAKNAATEAFRKTTTINASLLLLATLAAIGFTWLTLLSINRPLKNITQALKNLARGDLTVEVPAKERRDEIGTMAQAAQVFKEALQETVDQNWIQANTADISDAIQRTHSHNKAAKEILDRLVPLLGCGQGLFYHYNEADEQLEILASYAHGTPENIQQQFALGEGLIGQCALKQEVITLNNLPDDYSHIHSGLGDALPNTVNIIPLRLQGELRGVIEIASFTDFSLRQSQLLTEIAPVIALCMNNLTKSVQTQQLLGQTQSQAKTLIESETELKLREEELNSSNEELRQQTEALQLQATELEASEEELRTQQKELKTINERLRDKSIALELAKEKAEEDSRELQQANRYKSQFLANMSHELRTPLNSLLILSQGLADNDSGNLNEEDIESANTIYESGTALLGLINDILDLSKIEAGEIELHFEEVHLADIKHNITRHFDHVATDKGIELSTETDENLPESIYTDPSKLQQIINNLLSNALKFTDFGHIKISFQRPSPGMKTPGVDNEKEACIAIAVTDTGVGIPSDKLTMIFEAFKQVDSSTSRRFGGTGLGLSISLKLATLLGGAIQVESEENKGSTFTLFLPVTKPNTGPAQTKTTTLPTRPQHPDKPPSPEVQATETPSQLSKPFDDDRESISNEDKTIVVIEDDIKFAKYLYRRAHRKGFKCIVATDGESGLTLVRQYLPTGIILDIGLPNIDGWAVMSQLKSSASTRNIPVHIISALDDRNKGSEEGAIGYLTKPVTQEQISSAFERIQRFTEGSLQRLLIIEDDPSSRLAVTKLVSSEEVVTSTTDSGEQALRMLKTDNFDCIILDLGLPGISGFQFLEQASFDPEIHLPPVVIYSGKKLSDEENIILRGYTDSIVIKGPRSMERLLDEVTLFLHSVHESLPAKQRQMLNQVLDREKQFSDKRVLVVDDDMRSAFALSKALRAKGLTVEMAKDGQSALTKLSSLPKVNLVLMDMMMPGMDGFEATREIRKQSRFHKLPVIAVTAKAMPGDREACLEAGANDYLSKPIDMEKLLSMIRVWL